ncbi:cyclophilin-like fold protein [Salinicola rhizosphaerae]|uniref:Cyclophilin-like domain-containing protein n=1 Tax=Salinicola rhizosphaerae TaxID=1443141 RepID=A0ABQ3DSK8_9GAMM|nr:cyclophilin-like fold protein [Salinicola rhizosphaerae]GHB13413.1 hypothetical protein GCM10009038_09500 [Salinicola rhizosphaerae]
MRILFVIGGCHLGAVLDETPAARAFADLLPLQLSLSDFGGGVEKVADLPRSLPVSEAPDGMAPQVGDIAYYAPWGNLAIFRQTFGYAKGLVRLGQFASHFAELDRSGRIVVTIALDE